MADKFCGQCGEPLLKPIEREVKPTWGLAWGLLWRQCVIMLGMYIPFAILIWIAYLMTGVSG